MRAPNDITGAVVDAAIEIHRTLGPGLLESAYEEIMVRELRRRGLAVEQQLMIPVLWKGEQIEFGFRLDLLVDQRVIVELKSTERPAAIHARQLLTYLRVMNLPVGLLINFGPYRLMDGVQRIINNQAPPDQIWRDPKGGRN